MFLQKLYLFVFFLLVPFFSKGQLILNEISLGSASGSEAFVELVVYGESICKTSNIDISGWIIDDNNGFHGTSGINDGCIRFSASAQWQSMRAGSIIVIYNELAKGSSIPEDDPTDANNDYVYILPANSTLLERHSTLPSASSSTYPSSGFSTASGGWSLVGLNGDGDSFQIINPDTIDKSHHSLSFGNNTSATMINFSGYYAGKEFYLNGVDNFSDPFKQNKWSSGNSPSDETPGSKNNSFNEEYLNTLQQAFTPIVGSAAITKPTCIGACDGEVTAAGQNGFGSPYKWSWVNPSSATPKISSLCAGTYQIRITDPIGCYLDTFFVIAASTNFNVTATATPTKTCQGFMVQLVASGANTYSWQPIGSEFGGAVGSSVSINPLTTNNYSVIGTKSTCIDTAVVLVSVDYTPNLIISGNDSICKGSSTTLTVSGANDFEWSQSGSVFSNNSTITVSPNVLTIYTVIGISSGCTDTNKISVTVIDMPNLSINGTSPICSGTSTSLIASGAETYSWSPATALTSTSISNPIANPNISIDYTLNGANGNGLCTDVDYFSITVNPTPFLTLTGDTYICFGESSIVSLTGAPSYSWTPATGLSSTLGNQNTAQPSASTIYTISGYTPFCKRDTTFNLEVNTPANLNTTTTINICKGNSKQLNASGALYYTWTPNIGLSSNTISNPTVNTLSSITYTLTGSNDCPNTNDVEYIQFNVVEYPQLSFTLDDVEGCTPFNLSLKASDDASDVCSWSFQNGAKIDGCLLNIDLKDTGSYNLYVSVINQTGCRTDSSMIRVVKVHPLPKADFNYLPEKPTIINPGIDFINKSKGADVYQWFFENDDIITAQNPTYQYPDTGEYEILLIARTAFGCADSITKKLHIDEETVFYMPNAFSPNGDNINDEFFIVTKGIQLEGYELKIFDRGGQITYVSTDYRDKWDGKVQGKIIPTDTYTYKLKFTDFKGANHTKKGQLQLIR